MSDLAQQTCADVTRLYRVLCASGATFPRMRLRLHDDSAAVVRMGFRLIKCAVAQLEPDVALVHSGRARTDFVLRVPALSRMSYLDRERLCDQLSDRFRAFYAYPLRVVFCVLPYEQRLWLRIYASDSLNDAWYRDHSLCDFWRIFRSTIAEVRRREAEEAQRQHAVAARYGLR